MSDVIALDAEPREARGKGGARALRREGKIPAIIYGGKDDNQAITLGEKEIKRQLEMNPRFFSMICELKLGRKKIRAIAREAQVHPVTDVPLHVDFLRVTKGAMMTVEVPVTFLNEETSVGLKRGGVLNIVRREIEVVCPVESIPDEIQLDLAEVDIGASVHISSIDLPDNVTPTITDRDFTICTIVGRGPQGDEEGEEGEEGDEGEASED